MNSEWGCQTCSSWMLLGACTVGQRQLKVAAGTDLDLDDLARGRGWLTLRVVVEHQTSMRHPAIGADHIERSVRTPELAQRTPERDPGRRRQPRHETSDRLRAFSGGWPSSHDV